MTVVCGLDLETTGLDLEKDHIVELSYVIAKVESPRPLHCSSMLLYDQSIMGKSPMPKEATAVNHITDEDLYAFGNKPSFVYNDFFSSLQRFGCEYILAHNGSGFDKPMLCRVDERGHVFTWIDTRADIIYPHSTSLRLNHLAADHGFLNPFPHTGLSDVMTMLRIVALHDFSEIIERSRVPWILVKAMVSYENRDAAKRRRYFWETFEGKTYYRTWVKKIKEDQFLKEQVDSPFPIERMP